MSLRFCVLASGSKGNAVYVESSGRAVLIDCGLSAKELLRRMDLAGLDPYAVEAIVITHEHRDHSAGAGVAARRLRVPVLALPPTLRAGPDLGDIRHQAFDPQQPFTVGGLTLHPFRTPHDAADPIGLRISAGAASLGLCTDLGKPTNLVRQRLSGCQGLILEMNHDPAMLAGGPYPVHLKQRVRGPQGHLSNRQGAELAGDLSHPELVHLVAAHLSETNNLPDLARQEALAILEEIGSSARLTVAGQWEPSPVLDL